ncbi:MAG: response regulator [Pseudobdellovibrio sp.]
MALRVLLADESTTIKKVLQLALSDMGVEVKNVPSGIDVLSVALDFNPDIIFADILLSKKNGYEVCAEVKNHPDLAKIPVVLMWSSFMEFDEKLAQRSNYNGQLEKPFDTEILRSLVNRLVAKTNSHPLKGLLEFPTIPDFIENDSRHSYQKTNSLNTNTNSSHLFEEVDLHFGEKTAPGIKHTSPKTTNEQEINNTRVDLNNPAEIQLETENYGDFEEVILVKSENSATQLNNKIKNQVQSYIENTFAKPSPLGGSQQNHKPIFDTIPEINIPQTSSGSYTHQKSGFENQQKWQQQIDENLIREEVRVMAEKVCWQIIPDLAEKLIREELKKVMQDIEKSL